MAISYSDESIKSFDNDVEKIQESPSMYIGYEKWEAFIHLIKEVIQNSVDEGSVEDSPCDSILVMLDEKEKLATIIDNGRGIPLHSIVKVATILQSSGKFKKGGKNAYGYAAGMHGVGLTAANALSVKCTITVFREGIQKTVEFEYGRLVSEKETKCPKSKTGTMVSFIPNEQILKKITCKSEELIDLCKTMAVLSKMRIQCVINTKNGKEIIEKFNYKNGIHDIMKEMMSVKLVDPIYIEKEEILPDDKKRKIEIAFTYAPGQYDEPHIISYANYCTTVEHGKHVDGFRLGVTQAFSKYIKENILTTKEKDKINITQNDVLTDIVAIVNVFDYDIKFSGQIKAKVINDELVPFVRATTYNAVTKWIKENPKSARKVGEWIRSNAKMRMKASEEKSVAINQKGFNNAFSENSIRFYRKATGSPIFIREVGLELLIVEGESAGGNAAECRDKRFQEIIFLRGVTKGVMEGNGTIDQIISKNEVYRALVTIIGAGYGKKFNLAKCRYKRIIIMTDADVDGNKITSGLCAFFMRAMPELVADGRLYKVVPPLYSSTENKKTIYLKDNKDYAKYIEKKIADNIKVYDLNGERISKSELSNLIIYGKRYLKDMKKTSKQFVTDPLLLEYLMLNSDKLKDGEIAKFKKILKKKYPDINIIQKKDFIELDGFITIDPQYIKLDKKKIKRLYEIRNYVMDHFDGKLNYIVNDEKCTLYEVARQFKSYEPKGLSRFKGLGEMDAQELKSTTIDPENRTLIRLRMKDLEKELDTFNILHSKTNKWSLERKKMMKTFKIDIDDIDT